ncbi:PREDICTED: uncharacterized protein LOC108564571, partial [Nicrophorus vespilloides]|uniref:Uncharacterized protein LOC108564571 n=1 Tax=Nicrophorus vespilloides TaxID=110193 RepID=A0ABM1MX43_NICVS
ELMVLVGGEMRWYQRRVTVRGGQLILAGCPGELSSALRIPLRQLSLQAGPLPNSLSLVKGKTVLLTLQTSNERSFDLWVKTVAIEVIRQTPLESVRYLDIFTLTENSEKRKSNHPLESPPPTPSCIICPPPNEPSDCNRNTTVINRNLLQPPNAKPSPAVDVLLQRCQSTENYVPVKEKLALFESLCRIGRVNSTEDVSFKVDVGTKRARSMHDLTYCFSTAGVREMCKYFETKLDDEPGCGGRKRFINSDSNLSKVKFTFSRTLQDVSYA